MKQILFIALLLLSLPAQAHVTANPDHGMAGEYFQTSFRISHGCEDKDTTAIRVFIPPGFLNLKPQYKSGWKVTFKMRKLDKPMPAGHGRMADEEFAEVIWSGNILPANQYDEFGILIKLPSSPRKLWFPVTQECGKDKLMWSDIPGPEQSWHEVKHPAPFVQVNGKSE